MTASAINIHSLQGTSSVLYNITDLGLSSSQQNCDHVVRFKLLSETSYVKQADFQAT